MTKHSNCEHPATKAARAACRRQRVSEKPSSFAVAEAFAMNDMWRTLNSAQEDLINRYRIVFTTCAYCENETTCFVFERLGINVCGGCERMHDVHKHEEEII